MLIFVIVCGLSNVNGECNLVVVVISISNIKHHDTHATNHLEPLALFMPETGTIVIMPHLFIANPVK